MSRRIKNKKSIIYSLLFFFSISLTYPIYASENSGIKVNENKSATEIRTSISQQFRQSQSDIRTGPVITEKILIDQNSNFESNLKWMAIQMEPRIWGGEIVLEGKYSDVVGIFHSFSPSGLPNKMCTGVLISDKAVLTAAHCVCDGATKHIGFGVSLDSESKVILVKDSTVYPGMNCEEYRSLSDERKNTYLRGKDLAILELAEKVPSDLAVPRRIADSSIISTWNNKEIRVVGYGLNEKMQIGRKMHADVAIVSSNCSRKDADDFLCEEGLELIAQSKDFNTDTCHGDSGGPAYIFDETSDHYYLLAITSRGLSNKPKPCGYGGIYALVNSQSSVTAFLSKHASPKIGRNSTR